MALKTLRHAVTATDVGRADLLVQRLVGGARAHIRGLFDHDCVSVDGEVCEEAGFALAVGMGVAVHYDPHTRYHPKPRARLSRVFKLVFEDEHLIVVDKSAGFLTEPSGTGTQMTLVHEVARYLSRGPRITRRAHIVHRLDRDTSGLLVFGKRHEVAEAISEQFAARKPLREYVAIVAGHLRDDQGSFESYLATASDLDQYSTDDAEEGKLAITHFTVVERLRSATWITVTLETGRRNQIRVHFAEVGHPVLGDTRYEPERARHGLWPHKRLALHATLLGFDHPITGAKLEFRAEPPPAFAQFRAQARLPDHGRPAPPSQRPTPRPKPAPPARKPRR